MCLQRSPEHARIAWSLNQPLRPDKQNRSLPAFDAFANFVQPGACHFARNPDATGILTVLSENHATGYTLFQTQNQSGRQQVRMQEKKNQKKNFKSGWLF